MTGRIKAPFPWFGGKSRASDLVWSRLGKIHNYVEPFAGSLAVLFGRPHAASLETVNDLDCYVANFWRAVTAEPAIVAHYADWPVNEADLHSRHRWLINTGAERVAALRTDPMYYDAQVAGWWVWGICAWIGNGWCSVPDARRPHLSHAGQGIHALTGMQETMTKETFGGAKETFGGAKRPQLDGPGKGIHSGQIPTLNGHGKGVNSSYSPGRIPQLDNGGRGVHSGCWQKRPAISNGGRGVHAPARKDGLETWFVTLQERLRDVRVVCGDWTRVLTPAVTVQNGLTGVLLDPPYDPALRHRGCYAQDEAGVSALVRTWALENGDNPQLRIALCGYEGEHAMPSSWECVAWKAGGGYGNQQAGRGRANAQRERIWFSPHCQRAGLFAECASEVLL